MPPVPEPLSAPVVKRAIATKQVDVALRGDVRTFLAIAKLLDRAAHARDRDVGAPAVADEAIIDAFLARRLASAPTTI